MTKKKPAVVAEDADITTLDAPVEPEPAVEGEVVTAAEAQAPATAIVVSEPAPLDATGERRLNQIAKAIRAEVGKGIEAAFKTGHLLSEARELLRGDAEFGKWFREQELGISQPTANRLRWAAENEPAVREALAHSARNGRDIGVATVVKELNAGPQPSEELKAAGKRVRDLIAEDEDPDEGESGFPAFRAAAGALNLQVLTTEDLAAFAAIIQKLVADYGEERKRRSS